MDHYLIFNIIFSQTVHRRHSSSDTPLAEVVVPSAGDKMGGVNVDLDKWESAEKLLGANLQFQPIVCVQKLNVSDDLLMGRRTVVTRRNRSPPRRSAGSRPRRMPASPKSPRILRRPRGGWYRDKY